MGGGVVLAHVVELVWVLKVDVAHEWLGAPLGVEFIYLHGLVLQGRALVYPK